MYIVSRSCSESSWLLLTYTTMFHVVLQNVCDNIFSAVMSGLYTSPISGRSDAKMYGFQTCTRAEVESISQRLHFNTASRMISSLLRVGGEENRSGQGGPVICPKSGLSELEMRLRRRVKSAPPTMTSSERNSNKEKMLVTRLQKPTSTYLNYKAATVNQREDTVGEDVTTCVEATSHSNKEWIERLCRQTESSHLKRLGACSYCRGTTTERMRLDRKLKSGYMSQERRPLSQSDLEEFLARVRRTTNASSITQGVYRCPKAPNYAFRPLDHKTPLISGLPRSLTVEEITLRLFPNHNGHGH